MKFYSNLIRILKHLFVLGTAMAVASVLGEFSLAVKHFLSRPNKHDLVLKKEQLDDIPRILST